jgi:hypothetical protein
VRFYFFPRSTKGVESASTASTNSTAGVSASATASVVEAVAEAGIIDFTSVEAVEAENSLPHILSVACRIFLPYIRIFPYLFICSPTR